MLLTEKEIRKVIRESILAHSGERNMVILETKAKNSRMLVETHRGIGFVTFGSLLERADRGLISSDQLSDILEEDFERINHQLLQEGVLDLVSQAYESTKQGLVKLKDSVSEKVAAAMVKINEKYIEWTTKVWMLAQKGTAAAAKVIGLISKGLSAIGRFKKKHPILYKVIIFTLICVVLFILMAIMSSPAHAEIVQNSGKPMNDQKYNATLGVLKDMMRNSSDMQESQKLMDAMAQLEKAHTGGQSINSNTLSTMSQGAIQAIDEALRTAKAAKASGDTGLAQEILEGLNQLQTVAKNANVSMNGIEAPMGI